MCLIDITVDDDGIAHAATDRVPNERPRKIARLDENLTPQLNDPPTMGNSTFQQSPSSLDLFLAKLSPETVAYIFELRLEDTTSSEEYNSALEELALQGGRCFEVLETTPSFWTRVTSNSSEKHIKRALGLSKARPLSIEGSPSHSMGVAANVKHINRFLGFIDSHKNRWASFELLFPSGVLKTLKKHLADPSPSLKTLSLTMSDPAPETEPALPLEDALNQEIGRPLEILGGEAGNLRRVFFNNIPCLWDPSPFTSILELGLTNRIHLRYTELVIFLRHTPKLLTLRLINIKFVDGAPRVVKETIGLPYLRELVLAELVEPIGLGHLYTSLDVPKCEKLHLDIRPPVAVMIHAALPTRPVPVVQRALAGGKESCLLFCRNTSTQSASWRSEDEGGPERPSFDITFRGTDRGLAEIFSRFVRGVRIGLGETGDIVVDVGDSLSGAIEETFGLELESIVPTLFHDSLEGLGVVEVRAEVVDGYFQHLHEMIVPPGSEDWVFDALKTIRMCAIRKEELEIMPDESARCCLEDET